MASTTFRFLKFGTSRQFFFQILCSKKNFENFFWSDQKTGLTARRVHYGPFRSPRSISGPYQKMTIPLLNSPKPHPLLIRVNLLFLCVKQKSFILRSGRICSDRNTFPCLPQCSFGLTLIKSKLCYISKKYLTTNDPYWNRIQKNFKIRNSYSPDPDSGSGIPKI